MAVWVVTPGSPRSRPMATAAAVELHPVQVDWPPSRPARGPLVEAVNASWQRDLALATSDDLAMLLPAGGAV